MDFAEADYYVSRIISGKMLVKVKDAARTEYTFFLNPFEKDYRYLANELYREVYQEGIAAGLFTDSELQSFLIENEIWTPYHEAKLQSLIKDVDELKLKMFECSFKADVLLAAKNVLKHAKADIVKLAETKMSYNHISASGLAETEKNKFLIGISLYKKNGKRLLNDNSYWKFPAFILEQVVSYYRQTRITEEQCRWLARNEPWRGYWTARKAESGVLGTFPADMTDEQRALIAWSNIYDNVQEHPECPSQDVINDDDVMDGWFILQKQKREKEMNTQEVQRYLGNDKIKNAGEIFIPVSEMSIDKIASMNDIQGQLAKKQRFGYIDKHGDKNIPESNMPDTRLEIQMQRNRMFKDAAKG